MNTKPFLNYQDQIDHLSNDKHIDCSGIDAKTILSRNGYFNIINGYKSLKKFLLKTDESFFHDIPYTEDNNILDISNEEEDELNESVSEKKFLLIHKR